MESSKRRERVDSRDSEEMTTGVDIQSTASNNVPSSIATTTRAGRLECDQDDIIDAVVAIVNPTRASKRYDSPHHVDEDTKMQLAMRTSRATAPGAVLEGEDTGRRTKQTATQDNLGDYWNSRMILKNRPAINQNDDPTRPSPEEEQGLDWLQKSMTEHQDDANKIEAEYELTRRRQFRKRMVFVAVGMLLAVVGIIVGIVVGIRSGQERNGDEARAKAFADCLADANYASSRFLEQRFVVLTHTPRSTVNNTDAPGSHQRAALCWISEVDRDTEGFEDEGPGGVTMIDQVIQRFALACIYYHFVPPGTSQSNEGLLKSNWLSAAHVCEWDFLLCDGQRVVQLSLNGLKLGKNVPSELAFLSYLTVLNLEQSGLVGTIPSDLSSLTNLEILNLGVNELTGEISSEMAELGHLRQLSLPNNKLVGQIPVWIFQIPFLDHLDLGGNRLTGTLPNALSNGTSLSVLSLYRNGITGTIPDISQLTKLRVLNLESNPIKDAFPDVSKLTNLELLDLYYVELSGTIPSSLLLCSSLKALKLAYSTISGTIPTGLGLLTNLDVLGLGGSKLFGRIPSELGKLVKLMLLDLGSLPDLTGTFPSELAQLSKLEVFLLPERSLISETVPPEICDLLNNADFGSRLDVIYGPCQQCDCCACQNLQHKLL